MADYRLRHGRLPLGWVALLAQPSWASGIVLLGMTILLFSDGRLPSPRWRWVLWVYVAVAVLWDRAGWRRWLARRSATGARRGNAASS